MSSTHRFGSTNGTGIADAELEPMADRTGEVLDGRYTLTRLIGEGGMGHVYEGEHVVTGRKVAVKLLLPQLNDNREAVKRFYREARAAAAIGSEHICQVLDMCPPDQGAPFLVMEYLDGETLADRIDRDGPMAVGDVVDVACQILEGLEVAHHAGIVHRDIKPDNIFLARREGQSPQVKLVDFGISKIQASAEDSLSLTKAGTVLGTPQYMSPEQARGDPDLGPMTDLYAVGVILYEALTGRVPFEAETFSSIVVKIVMGEAEHPHVLRPDLPQGLGDVVMRAFGRNPEDRFPSARYVIEALRPFAPDRVRQSALPEDFDMAEVTGAGAHPMGERTKSTTQTPMHWERTSVLGGGPGLKVAIAALTLLLLGAIGFGVYWFVPGLRTRTTVLEVARIESGPPGGGTVTAAATSPEGDGGAAADDAAPPARTIHVMLSVSPDTATIHLDGEALDGNPVEVGLPADGAAHTVRATAPGHLEASQIFTATGDEELVLTLMPEAPRHGKRPPRHVRPHPTPPPPPTPPPTGGPTPSVHDPWAGGR